MNPVNTDTFDDHISRTPERAVKPSGDTTVVIQYNINPVDTLRDILALILFPLLYHYC